MDSVQLSCSGCDMVFKFGVWPRDIVSLSVPGPLSRYGREKKVGHGRHIGFFAKFPPVKHCLAVQVESQSSESPQHIRLEFLPGPQSM